MPTLLLRTAVSALLLTVAVAVRGMSGDGDSTPGRWTRVEADFTVIRTVPLMSGQIRSSGHLSLTGEGDLRWETTGAEPYVFEVISGIPYLTRDGSRSELGRDSSPVYSRIASAIPAGADPFTIDRRLFSVSEQEQPDGSVYMEAKPLRRDLASLFTKITLTRKGAAVSEVTMFAASGALVKVMFNNVRIYTEQ